MVDLMSNVFSARTKRTITLRYQSSCYTTLKKATKRWSDLVERCIGTPCKTHRAHGLEAIWFELSFDVPSEDETSVLFSWEDFILSHYAFCEDEASQLMNGLVKLGFHVTLSDGEKNRVQLDLKNTHHSYYRLQCIFE